MRRTQPITISQISSTIHVQLLQCGKQHIYLPESSSCLTRFTDLMSTSSSSSSSCSQGYIFYQDSNPPPFQSGFLREIFQCKIPSQPCYFLSIIYSYVFLWRNLPIPSPPPLLQSQNIFPLDHPLSVYFR